MKKSPSRKSSRNPSPGRKVEKQEVKRSRSRSRSRGRPPKGESKSRSASTKSKSKKSPARTPVSESTNSAPKPKNTEKPKISSVERDEIIRNSLSRFDDIASKAVVTLRKSTRQIYSSKEAKTVDEVNSILKENNLETKELEKRVEPRLGKKEKEFGGVAGVFLLILLLPAVVLFMQLACTRVNCTMKGFVVPLNWKKYLDFEASYYYIGFQLVQLLLSSLPIGFHAHLTSGKYVTLSYRCNGLISGVVTLGGLYGLHKVGWLNTSVVLDRSLQMCVSAVLCAAFLSLGLHLGSPPTKHESSVYDFWIGRRVSPRYKSFDLKIALIRASLVTVIAHNCILLFVECQGKTTYYQYATSSIIAAVLQILYATDFLVFESSFLDSFMVRHEATGYMLIMSLALHPFFVTILPKYLYYNKVSNSNYVIAAVIFFYTLGYVLFRLSNSQKAAFKKISYPLQMSGVEVIESTDGRRLLAGGLWGRVRHPNHLGAALANVALGGLVAGGPLHWAPLLPAVLTSLALAHRAKRESASCATRYGLAWSHYASKVKNDLIPGVF